jgi:hypothetical protein
MNKQTMLCAVLAATLAATLGAAPHSLAAEPEAASTSGPMGQMPRIGVQLWSVKDEIKQDFEGTLTRIAKLGFQGVEFAGEFGPYKANPAALKTFLDKNGLQCAS